MYISKKTDVIFAHILRYKDMILLITLEFCFNEKQNIFGIVDFQITITLNCLDGPAVDHYLLAWNIMCWAYRDMIKGDRPIYLSW
jgi:hypothetical protein